jgi:hypothetical protein
MRCSSFGYAQDDKDKNAQDDKGESALRMTTIKMLRMTTVKKNDNNTPTTYKP